MIHISILRPLLKAIDNCQIVSSSEIIDMFANSGGKSSFPFESIVEELAESGCIKLAEPILEEVSWKESDLRMAQSSLTFTESESLFSGDDLTVEYGFGAELWRLTEEAIKDFKIRLRNPKQSKRADTEQEAIYLIEERARKARKGQGAFRDTLINLYGQKCMVSGCTAEQALEAAHIIPYAHTKCNLPENGLLLRADIHTLFDQLLLSINPNSLKVIISQDIAHTEYATLQDIAIQPHKSFQDKLKERLKGHFKAFSGEANSSIWRKIP